MGFALIGYLVMSAVLGFGIYYLFTNVTFKNQKEKYSYRTDEHENDGVKDHTDPLN